MPPASEHGRPVALVTPVSAQPALTLGQAIDAYVTAKSGSWTRKTRTIRERYLGYLREHIGADRPLEELTVSDIRGYRDAVMRLRRNRGREQVQTFLAKQTQNEKLRISASTAALIYVPCQAFFRWAVADQGYIDRNPAENVRISVPKSTKGKVVRRPFSADELQVVFSAPLFTGCLSAKRRFTPGGVVVKDAYFWVPILAFYTGARLGELVQLHLADIELQGPVPYIHVREDNSGAPGGADAKHVKSEAGVRKIPIHPDLFTLGFDAFVSRRRKINKSGKRLFPEIKFGADGQASTVFSKWFGRFMSSVGLKDPSLVFHSFRHNAEDAFRNAGQQQYVIDRIIGHADGATSAGYGEGIDLETSYAAVSSMKLKISLPSTCGQYDNLNLPDVIATSVRMGT